MNIMSELSVMKEILAINSRSNTKFIFACNLHFKYSCHDSILKYLYLILIKISTVVKPCLLLPCPPSHHFMSSLSLKAAV